MDDFLHVQTRVLYKANSRVGRILKCVSGLRNILRFSQSTLVFRLICKNVKSHSGVTQLER